MSKGVLAVVSGFSGAGKGTVMKKLLESFDDYALSVSVTTRKPRPGEVDGKDYFFRTKEEVEEMIAQDQLLEYARYVDNYYGTPRSYVEEKLSEGKNVILEITETQEVIESRLSRAAEEAEGMEDYDYLLINDDLEECVNELHRIISSERCKTQRNTEFINRIQEESRGLMKGDL